MGPVAVMVVRVIRSAYKIYIIGYFDILMGGCHAGIQKRHRNAV